MLVHNLAELFHFRLKRQALCYAVAENYLTVFICVNTHAEMTDTVVELLGKIAVLTAGDRLHLEAAGVVCARHYHIAELDIIFNV